MKASELADTIALMFKRSHDIAFKKSVILDAIAYRAVLLKQQIDKESKLSQQYVVELKNIPLVESDGAKCLTIEQDLPSWIVLPNRDFYRVEILDENKCCQHTSLYESTPSRAEFASHGRFGGKLPFYVIENKKPKVHGVDKNAKYINVYYIPNNMYEISKYNDFLGQGDVTGCKSSGDMIIEETFKAGIIGFLEKQMQVYRGTEEGEIDVAPDKD